MLTREQQNVWPRSYWKLREVSELRKHDMLNIALASWQVGVWGYFKYSPNFMGSRRMQTDNSPKDRPRKGNNHIHRPKQPWEERIDDQPRWSNERYSDRRLDISQIDSAKKERKFRPCNVKDEVPLNTSIEKYFMNINIWQFSGPQSQWLQTQITETEPEFVSYTMIMAIRRKNVEVLEEKYKPWSNKESLKNT